MKTNELIGAALDWAVAKAEHGHEYEDIALLDYVLEPEYGMEPFEPSTNWTFGGPIIEREGVTVCWQGATWVGSKFNVRVDGEYEHHQAGPTPLIAAMRCYVASKLGGEVEVPDELN